MEMPPLKCLRELSVLVVHAPDEDGRMLADHIKRIGCRVEMQWPVPSFISPTTDAIFLSVDHENRTALLQLARNIEGIPPTIVAVVDYENPSMLEILFDVGALAAVERPIRPFGVLTNLLLARGLWIEQNKEKKRIAKLERKLASVHRVQRAKTVLMQLQHITEEAAYETIRRQAMLKRVPMEEIASSIIDANELLHSVRFGD
jgi:AmiR/NasT family two-component response regulator